MTELAHPPPGIPQCDTHSDMDESEQEDHSEDEHFSLCEYDLDVVDEALANPNSAEYRDHFGFRIQVKTDDEQDDDSSDSDSDFSEPDSKKKTKGAKVIDHDKPSLNHSGSKEGSAVSSITTTSSEDDDTDFSVDTAMTTPTALKAPHRLSSGSTDLHELEEASDNVAPLVKNLATAAPARRGRSGTLSRSAAPPLATITQNSESVEAALKSMSQPSANMTPIATRRGRSGTVSQSTTPPPLPPALAQTLSKDVSPLDNNPEKSQAVSTQTTTAPTARRGRSATVSKGAPPSVLASGGLPPTQEAEKIVREVAAAKVEASPVRRERSSTVSKGAGLPPALENTLQEISETPVETSTPIPAAPARRSRSATVSKPAPLPAVSPSAVQDIAKASSENAFAQAPTGRRRRATTVSRPQPPTLPTSSGSKPCETVSEEEEPKEDETQVEMPKPENSNAPTEAPVEKDPVALPTREEAAPEEESTITTRDEGPVPEGNTVIAQANEEAAHGTGSTLAHTNDEKSPEKESISPRTSAEAVMQSTPMEPSSSTASMGDRDIQSQPFDNVSIRSGNSFDYQRSRSDSNSRLSLSSLSFNPFKRAGSPSSTRTATRVVERPSQAFRERQSRRMSQFYRSQSQAGSPSGSIYYPNDRLSSASASSYYEMLMAKFGRSSEEYQQRDSAKHIALKEEAKQQLERLKETNQDYDWDFWISFVADMDHCARSQPEAVRHHLILGIPPAVRGLLWQIISRSRNNGELESEYRELLKRVSPHEKAIRRDLSRTFPAHEFFQEQLGQGQEALFNVIKAYSLFDQEVGYCQGLPFVVGCLLLNMSDEAAYTVLIKLMSQYGLRGHYTPQMETVHERLYQFDHILEQKLPHVHRHLAQQGVPPSSYASQWFITLFSYKAPLHLVFRVMDVMLVEGPHIVLRFALALMFRNQNALMGLEFESLVHFLNNSVFDAYRDDENGFVQDAYNIEIPMKLLARLAKQHASELARESKIQNQEEHLRRVNAELSEHVRRLEKSYRTLESEHQEVTRQVIDAKMNMARMDDENQQLRWQLSQVRNELEQLKKSMPTLEELSRQNKQLTQRNEYLENQVTDMEAILVSLKMKYAESESAYEMLKQKLHKAGISQ